MKIHCDVCEKGEASVFCVADEAALCSACDHRVHFANKLAGKHHRFSLLLPLTQFPVCDICQERRGYVFCQQDRAILCTECDIPIHKANEHTLKHNRFLLTGIKLSPEETPATDSANKPEIKKTPKSPVRPYHHQESKNEKGSNGNAQLMMNEIGIGGTTTTTNGDGLTSSSISGQFGDIMQQQQQQQLPDWHVEDFLDHPLSPTLVFFSKSGSSDGDGMPFWDSPTTDLPCTPNKSTNFTQTNNNGDWVPQAAAINPVEIQPFTTSWNMGMVAFGGQINFNQNKEDMSSTTFKANSKWVDDNSFAVPQTKNPSAVSKKRFRAFC